MAVVEKYALQGTVTPLATTALNSLANNALVACTVFDNEPSVANFDGYTMADVQLEVTFGTAPTANTGVSLWFLSQGDGTNYEDGSSSITPARLPDVVFPVRAVTTAQRINRRVMLPWGNITPLLKNDGTGQAFAASSNTLKIRPATRQGA
jgi:hypothetical protein